MVLLRAPVLLDLGIRPAGPASIATNTAAAPPSVAASVRAAALRPLAPYAPSTQPSPSLSLSSSSASAAASPRRRVGELASNLRRPGSLPTCAAVSPSAPPRADSFASTAEQPGMQRPVPPYAEGELPVPAWTGDHPVSRIMNVVIGIAPLYQLLRFGARNTMISSAEKKGVPWRRIVQELNAVKAELEREKATLENKAIKYPDYYLKPFHAYSDGNLNWEAAFEVEPATQAMYSRAIPWARTVEEAGEGVRRPWLDAVAVHHALHSGGLPIDSVLDIGCSVGASTCWLANEYPSAHVLGLDASPHFLAVASYRTKQRAAAAAVAGADDPTAHIEWMHALGEDTGLPSHSFALVSIAFTFHECPAYAIRDILTETKRVLKPGGTVTFTDNSPKSKVIQSIPTPIAAMMKMTEPHSDSYYLCDIEALMEELGFLHVHSQLADPRHRCVTATAPPS